MLGDIEYSDGSLSVTGGSFKIQDKSVVIKGNCSLLPCPQIGTSIVGSFTLKHL